MTFRSITQFRKHIGSIAGRQVSRIQAVLPWCLCSFASCCHCGGVSVCVCVLCQALKGTTSQLFPLGGDTSITPKQQGRPASHSWFSLKTSSDSLAYLHAACVPYPTDFVYFFLPKTAPQHACEFPQRTNNPNRCLGWSEEPWKPSTCWPLLCGSLLPSLASGE